MRLRDARAVAAEVFRRFFSLSAARVVEMRAVKTVPRLVAVLLVFTQASVLASTAAQTKTNPTPLALVVGIICYLARKQPIGGWLLYYYISLYSVVAFSWVILAATFQNYSPERWQSAELYGFAIASCPHT